MTRKNAPGAGRPRKDVTRISLTVTPEQATWLHQQPNASEIIRQLVEDKMNAAAVFTRLQEMGFTAEQIEKIAEWWRLYISSEHYEWFMAASKQEIEEASAPAFEEE